jgi:hypothetical protein
MDSDDAQGLLVLLGHGHFNHDLEFEYGEPDWAQAKSIVQAGEDWIEGHPRERSAWRNLLARESPKHYRGPIMVCERWKKSFGDFLSDVGPALPTSLLVLKDEGGIFEPGNVEWRPAPWYIEMMARRKARQP